MAWENDKLNRQQFATHLVELLLDRYQSRDSFIANLDAPWGQGKTFFLENLAEQLSDEGYAVAYVNAWQDDRTNTPLVAVLSAIDEAIRANQETTPKAIAKLNAARKVLAPVVGEVGKQMGKHALKLATGIGIDKVLELLEADDIYEADTDAINKGVDSVTAKRISNLVGERLKSQEVERKAIASFRDKTAEILASSDIKLPLFVIVDELDRCRPPYAVQMLEEMKHIFSISGIVFLIGTDTVQLSHSVNALYGEKFASQRYLRRFFDRVLVFPPVNRADFLDSLIDESFVDWHSFAVMGTVHPRQVFLSLFEGQGYSNRDIEQFVEILDTFASSWDENVKIEPTTLAALIDDYMLDPTSFPLTLGYIDNDRRRGKWAAQKNGKKTSDLARLSESILNHARNDLREYQSSWAGNEYFVEEFNERVANRMSDGKKLPSLITSYRSRIIMSARTVSEGILE